MGNFLIRIFYWNSSNLFTLCREEPAKVDGDVFTAIGEFEIDEVKYPLVYSWHKAMKSFSAKNVFKDCNNFRLFTPKLKSNA